MGYRISPDGTQINLYYGEIKINENNTLSLEQNQVQNNWQFTEVWIDPMLTPPYILSLLADEQGKCQIYDPAKNYQVIFSSNDYKTAKLWLLEDEYEPIEGRAELDSL